MSTSPSHHHHTRPLDALAVAAVVMLCLSWGFNQVSVKLAIHDIPPFTQAAIRSFGASLDRRGDRAGARAAAVCARRHAHRRRHRRPAVRRRVHPDLSGPGLHHRDARSAVHLSRAVLRRARHPRLSAGRPFPSGAMGGACAFLRRHAGRLRRADAGARSAPGHRRSDDGGRRAFLGRHHADHQGKPARPRLFGKDAALSTGGLGADVRARRLACRRAHGARALGARASARSPTRPSGWSASPS